MSSYIGFELIYIKSDHSGDYSAVWCWLIPTCGPVNYAIRRFLIWNRCEPFAIFLKFYGNSLNILHEFLFLWVRLFMSIGFTALDLGGTFLGNWLPWLLLATTSLTPAA
jgi:hypothetical protein